MNLVNYSSHRKSEKCRKRVDEKGVIVSEDGVAWHIDVDTVIISPAPIADKSIAGQCRLLDCLMYTYYGFKQPSN